MRRQYISIQTGGALLWFFQRVTGAILVIAVLRHLIGNLFSAQFLPLLNSPLLKIADTLFLLMAVFHGYNGLLNIVKDYKFPLGVRVFLYSMIVFLGIALIYHR